MPSKKPTAKSLLKRAEQMKWEDTLAFQLRVSGFDGVFVRNYRKAIPGRNLELDLADLKNKVGIEVQGGTWGKSRSGHSTGAGIRRDCEKANLMQLNGWRVLSFTTDQIRDQKALEFVLLFYRTLEILPGKQGD